MLGWASGWKERAGGQGNEKESKGERERERGREREREMGMKSRSSYFNILNAGLNRIRV